MLTTRSVHSEQLFGSEMWSGVYRPHEVCEYHRFWLRNMERSVHTTRSVHSEQFFGSEVLYVRMLTTRSVQLIKIIKV